MMIGKYRLKPVQERIRKGCSIYINEKGLKTHQSKWHSQWAGVSYGPWVHSGAKQPYQTKEVQIAAATKRIFPVMPEPDNKEIKGIKMFVKKHLKQFHPIPQQNEEDFASWQRNHQSYNGQRKFQLYCAFKSLLGVCDPSWSMEEYHHKWLELPERDKVQWKQDGYDQKCSSFIKCESYATQDKLPRFIQQRSDRAKAAVATCIHEVEKVIFKSGNFVKGMTQDEMVERISQFEGYKEFYVSDYSSFESGFNPQYTKVVEEEQFKHFIGRNNPTIAKIINMHYRRNGNEPVVNICENPMYRIKVVGTRMSGDMWTSLANGFSNKMNIMYNMYKRGITKYDFVVEGDDGLVAVNEEPFRDEDFHNLGFKIKLAKHTNLETTEFCGIRINPAEKQPLVLPDSADLLSTALHPKYFRSGEKHLKELLKSKAQSLYCVGKNTPVIAVLAWKIINLLKDVRYDDSWMDMWWKEFTRRMDKFPEPVITVGSRVLFEDQTGISVAEQLTYESFIKKQTDIFFELPFSTGPYDVEPRSMRRCRSL